MNALLPRLVNSATFLFFALSLAVKSGYSYGVALLLLAALITLPHWWPRRPHDAALRWLAFGFFFAGSVALLDVIHGALEIGIPYLSAYAFSTENWKRSPEEVRWLMGFNREVIHRRRDELDAMGVRIRWAGRRPRLWGSVIRELEQAEQQSRRNTKLVLQFCVNYGGRAEIRGKRVEPVGRAQGRQGVG